MAVSLNDDSNRRAPVLSELDLPGCLAWAAERDLPAYRGRQLWHALQERAIQQADEITEFPLALRRDVQQSHEVRTVRQALHLTSPSDGAEKALLALRDGARIETVLIPARDGRRTVCVSSQVGCPAACSFCATGLGGFGRNLTAAEISDQVMYFAHLLRGRGERITNLVFMGMGEPFLNAEAVRRAVERLTDPNGFGLGERNITVSTVGIVPQIYKFTEWPGQLNLAVSLHAPNDELRSTLVPYNRHFPIGPLLESVRHYLDRKRRRVSFEYVLLRGVNDHPVHARELAALLRPLGSGAHANLIPWNPFREGRFVRSEGPDADAFAAVLRDRQVNATIRHSKGLDISAACGQLREQARAVSVRPFASSGDNEYRYEPTATGRPA